MIVMRTRCCLRNEQTPYAKTDDKNRYIICIVLTVLNYQQCPCLVHRSMSIKIPG
jgi:hypothetical protein